MTDIDTAAIRAELLANDAGTNVRHSWLWQTLEALDAARAERDCLSRFAIPLTDAERRNQFECWRDLAGSFEAAHAEVFALWRDAASRMHDALTRAEAAEARIAAALAIYRRGGYADTIDPAEVYRALTGDTE